MKFVYVWTANQTVSPSEFAATAEARRKALDSWLPAPGTRLLQFLWRADFSGGFAVIEADAPDGRVLGRAPAIFEPWFRFEVVPVMDIPDAIALVEEAAGVHRAASARDGAALPDGPPFVG